MSQDLISLMIFDGDDFKNCLAAFSIWHILILVTLKILPTSWRVIGPFAAAMMTQFKCSLSSMSCQYRHVDFWHGKPASLCALKHVVPFNTGSPPLLFFSIEDLDFFISETPLFHYSTILIRPVRVFQGENFGK